MPDFNTVRFNEELVGRLMIAKMTGTDRVEDQNKQELLIQSTVERPHYFNSCADWLATIKEDNRLLQISRQKRKEDEEIMEANIQYHSNWLAAKFKTN